MPPRLCLAVMALCAASLLSACQTGGPGGLPAPKDGVTPNAVVGSEIEVTALDEAPAAAQPTAGEAAKPAGPDTAAPQASPAEAAEPTADGEATEAAPEASTEAAAEPAPQPDMAETPVTPKSEMQLACEKRGGTWFRVGKGDKRACVRQTKDAGKRCDRESQCDSVCLARSGTCAPFKPMYGCNEILQDNGARVTLCLE